MQLRSGEFLGRALQTYSVAGVQLSETRYQTGRKLPVHSHQHAYFCWVRQGAYEEMYGSATRVCQPGTIAFHPAGESHRQRMGSTTVLSFNADMDERWAARTGLFRESWSVGGGPLLFLVHRIHREFSSPDDVTPLALEALLFEMAVTSQRRTRDRNLPWLERVREVLHERFRGPVSFGELANEIGVHPSQLARGFRSQFRCCPGDYLRQLRLEEAYRLLKGSARPISQVAYECGFSDQSHLTRLFRRHLGTTPAAFRRQTR
jgi:AraC family transcriptional regulator